MAVRAPSVKRYVVRLSAEERGELEAMTREGKSSAVQLLKVRILLNTDVSEAGEGWSDSRIVEALETSVSMVYRGRDRVGWAFTFTAAAYNLARLPRLLATSA